MKSAGHATEATRGSKVAAVMRWEQHEYERRTAPRTGLRMANAGEKSAREEIGAPRRMVGNVECREISWSDKSARLAGDAYVRETEKER